MLQSIRHFWEEWQHHPNSDFDHFRLVCKLREDVISPVVVVVGKEEYPRGILVGRLERTVLRPKLGYINLPGVPVNLLNIVHEGLIGAIDEDMAKIGLLQIDHLFSKGQLDAVVFHHLSEDSAVLRNLGLKGMRSLGARRPNWSIHRELSLLDKPGFLLEQMKSKHRGWIKRKQRDLEAEFPAKARWKWDTSCENLNDLCLKVETVARTTYQRGLGAGFVNNEEHRQRLSLFARRGELRICLLEIDGIPKAFWLGTVYKGVFHSSATGYVPELRQFEVGTLMFIQMVDELVREGVKKVDFGLGDAQYKQRFGDRWWRQTTAYYFPPTIKGFLLRLYLGLCEIADHAARRVAARLGVFDKIKQYWRKRLSGGGSP